MTERPIEPLKVDLSLPEWGCIGVRVPPLTDRAIVRANETEDPFFDLLPWLEAILSGADAARWRVSEEGSLAQFIFVGESNDTLDRASARLLLMRANDGITTYQLEAHPVERLALVKSFYEAFRGLVNHPDYDAQQWELMGPDMEADGADFVTDGTYRRPTLRSMRSPAIEAAIGAPLPA